MAFDFCHRVTQNAFGGKGIVLGQQTKDKIVRRINNDHTVTFNTKFRYNKSKQHLECLTDINNDEWKPFALVRGWGKLHTKMSIEDSAIVQDTFAQMIVNKLNA
ncbi:hypothetical protein HYO65_gp230 [Tenacibaculum phage PTm1]|uniref:Uncharacterized protein n=2 Tax=Shirahamavirus PTm1 TaxID=2846435 RepID=A0A5S9BZ57_9CAUD|nr:hypothetical protein HYO65_gp230 [Tenacibaculum phage PTm1]BBI90622.1 hypothetical protein [Tenacibaculum phage PTm1]